MVTGRAVDPPPFLSVASSRYSYGLCLRFVNIGALRLIGSSKEPRRIHPKFHIKSKQRNPVAPKASGVIMYLNLFCVSASGSATDDSDGRSTQRFCQVVRHRQQSRGRCMSGIEAERTDVDGSKWRGRSSYTAFRFIRDQGSGAIKRQA